jgi:hypothetical protein
MKDMKERRVLDRINKIDRIGGRQILDGRDMKDMKERRVLDRINKIDRIGGRQILDGRDMKERRGRISLCSREGFVG